MSCCAPGAEMAAEAGPRLPTPEELSLASRRLGDGTCQVELAVPGVHCAACIQSVEKELAGLRGVETARLNLSTRRVTVRYREGAVPPLAEALSRIGYPAHIADALADEGDGEMKSLLRAVAVSGFAAGNIMLLSVSVWSGAEGATRDLFHFVSALIALPALIFAGGIYYRSAWGALRHGRMNMDVPIAIGVTLAYAMSLYETITHGAHAYFDASVTLLFFLLIGRTLDHAMRDRARAAVLGLSRMAPRGALVLGRDGAREYRPVQEIAAGDRLLVPAGDRVPVDCRVLSGASAIDASLVTGESRPVAVAAGDELRAGTLNLSGPLTLAALRPAADSFLAEMMRMLEAAEGGKTRYRRIAERVSALYAPVVHLGAALTFAGWMVADGDWHRAMTIAIAVLIITCPCALGLAVPIVQVVAARRLFEAGIMVRDGAAMERLAEADTVVFDKTGTLTMGQARLVDAGAIPADAFAMAAAIAAQSRHPASRAIAAAGPRDGLPEVERAEEFAGLGVEAHAAGATWKLGRPSWAVAGGSGSGTVLSRDGIEVARFTFEDRLRNGAREAVSSLSMAVGPVEMLSGDDAEACAGVARRLGIGRHTAGMLPGEKLARVEALAAAGRHVLMVGDGLNDAPALAAAHVSMAPASAADVGRNAADFVFLRDGLDAVPYAVTVARNAGRLVRQNIWLAILYNVVAVPVAVLGHVTPLIAAIAMSASSLLVIANALRLSRGSSAAPAPERTTGREAMAA